MTHRNPDRRWLDNPQLKVGKAQLNRIAKATYRNESVSDPQRSAPTRDTQATDRTQK